MSDRDLILPDLVRIPPMSQYGRWTPEWQQFWRDLYARIGSYSGEAKDNEATFVENAGGTAVNDDSTFDGYTVGEVVGALRELGILT